MNENVREKLAQAVGEFVSANRRIARLTQTELATRIEVTRQTVAMIESGRQLPSFGVLYRLAEVFNVEPSGLLPTRKELR